MSHEALLDTTVVEAASATGVLTVGSTVPVGRTVYAAAVWESGAGTIPPITSVTDDRGNTWTVDKTSGGSGNGTVAAMLARARVTTQLEIGDEITVLLGETRTRWALQGDSFDDVNATSPLDKTAANNNPGSASSLSSGTTTATAQAYELAIAVFGFGPGRTVTIPTGAGWAGTAKVETNAGSTDRAMQVIYKYTAATGTQEGTLTLSSASTYTGLVATYKATAAVPAGDAGPPLRRPQLRNLLVR